MIEKDLNQERGSLTFDELDPFGGSVIVGLAVLVQLADLHESLLNGSHGSQTPLAWVGVTIHYDTL